MLIAGPAAELTGLRLLVDHLHERFDLAVGLHVARRADRLSVDRDPFDGGLQVRAGGAPGAPVNAVSSASTIRATDVLPLVPAMWMHG